MRLDRILAYSAGTDSRRDCWMLWHHWPLSCPSAQNRTARHALEIQADYDPAGLLGRDLSVRPGFQALRVLVEIDADPSEEKQAFLQEVERRCPLADNLTHGTQLYSQLVDRESPQTL
jgi:hypothetical protein